MSLKPLDLQNLFVHLHQIGREQAARQEAPVHIQQVAGEEIKQKTLQSGEVVQASEDMGAGAEKIHDGQEQSNNQQESSQDQDDEQAEKERQKRDDPFRDPDLGNKIDISG